jgi:hypothetical protein
MNANAYTTGYRVPVDDDETGEVNFFFGNEVVQLQQVLFRFKINSLVSTIKTAGATSTTTGASSASTTASDGSSTPTSGASSSSTTASGDASHQHTIELQDDTSGNPVTYVSSLLRVSGGGLIATQAGTVPHLHDMPHTHDVSIPAHTHGMPHTHDVTAAVTVTYGVFKDDDAGRKYVLSELEWQVNGTGGFTPFETSITGVTDAGGGFIEVTTDIAHNLTNGDTVHIDDTTDYDGTYAVSSVAATTFRVVKAYVSSQTGKARTVADKADGGQWWELDITSRVQDSTNFRPNQENNLLEIQRRTGSGTASIDGFLSVRSIIQSIAYT